MNVLPHRSALQAARTPPHTLHTPGFAWTRTRQRHNPRCTANRLRRHIAQKLCHAILPRHLPTPTTWRSHFLAHLYRGAYDVERARIALAAMTPGNTCGFDATSSRRSQNTPLHTGTYLPQRTPHIARQTFRLVITMVIRSLHVDLLVSASPDPSDVCDAVAGVCCIRLPDRR